jgi:hypothetical protein
VRQLACQQQASAGADRPVETVVAQHGWIGDLEGAGAEGGSRTEAGAPPRFTETIHIAFDALVAAPEKDRHNFYVTSLAALF